MCVVFLCITVTHGNDEELLLFGFARIVDTTIGIVVALVIKQFPIGRGIKPPYTEWTVLLAYRSFVQGIYDNVHCYSG